jgi:hypothetical protein
MPSLCHVILGVVPKASRQRVGQRTQFLMPDLGLAESLRMGLDGNCELPYPIPVVAFVGRSPGSAFSVSRSLANEPEALDQLPDSKQMPNDQWLRNACDNPV